MYLPLDLPVEGRFHVADSSEPALLLVFWSRGSAETSSRLCVPGVFWKDRHPCQRLSYTKSPATGENMRWIGQILQLFSPCSTACVYIPVQKSSVRLKGIQLSGAWGSGRTVPGIHWSEERNRRCTPGRACLPEFKQRRVCTAGKSECRKDRVSPHQDRAAI